MSSLKRSVKHLDRKIERVERMVVKFPHCDLYPIELLRLRNRRLAAVERERKSLTEKKP